MKNKYAVAIRVNEGNHLTYMRFEGYSLEKINYNTINVDGVKIEFGEIIEKIIAE